MASNEIAFEGATPILLVANLEASVDYYVRVLGFEKKWQHGWFACVQRGRCGLFLSEGDQGHPGTWVWIGVGDAVALCEELRAKGAKIRHEPTNYSWALEMQVEDLDGNVLRMGSEPREGEPEGEWLDMNGTLWLNGRRVDG
jgi:catechol 2,3-dioxygenase-like lactoylglutathione lyase family enzyme